MFHSLRARLALAYVALIVGALLLLALLLINFTQNFYLQNLREQLTKESRLVAAIIAPVLSADSTASQLDPLVKKLGQDAQARITIIRYDGVVLGDSDELPANMDNHADRPEVQQAFATGYGDAIRFSRTLQRDLLYVATTIRRDTSASVVVRVAVPLNVVAEARTQIISIMLGAGALVSLVAVALAVFIARRLTYSLYALQGAVARFATGDLHAQARASQLPEINSLAQTMNLMAGRLDQTIHVLRSEQTHLSAILAHIADGLLLLDEQGCVMQVNAAAERILNARAGNAMGQPFLHIARDHEMARCLQDARTTGQEQACFIEQVAAQRFLRMVATPVYADDAPRTFLVLLQDLTQIRRLETMRRDFISNASHELRTPLASLQALVETLHDGALEDLPIARRFVAQMADEVHQLTNLINDLLDLSTIESGRAPLARKAADLMTLMPRVAARLQPQAQRAGVALRVTASGSFSVVVDESRIEQVLLNLIHNAIKFTPSGGQIECAAVVHETQVTVSVRDSGIGISPDDLPRIFERFYKVDKARIRGGTGLGLAIAKHIVEQHGGHIWAESVEGEGTTIVFTLPRAT